MYAGVEGSEGCDDGDTFTEGCGNATLETAGTYCSSACTTVVVISVDEVCDSTFSGGCWDEMSHQDLYATGYVHDRNCGGVNTSCNNSCSYCSQGCIGI